MRVAACRGRTAPATLMAALCVALSAWATVHAQPAGTSPVDAEDRRDRAEFGVGPLLDLARLARAGDQPALVRAVSALRGRIPLVEPDPRSPGRSIVTFLYLGDDEVRAVTLPQLRFGTVPFAQDAESPALPPRSVPTSFRRLRQSALWYLRLNLPNTALLGYTIACERAARTPGDPSRDVKIDEFLDPLNPEHLGRRGDVSILRLPGAPAQAWIVERPGAPKGRMEPASLHSSVLGETRRFSIYVPAGYEDLRENARLVFVFDGEWFASDLGATTVLDNLLHQGRIPPTVAVFVDPQETRDRDLVNSAAFARFVATELHPWVVARYRVSREARDTALAGASFGGLCAAFIALRYPGTFGNVLSQSGAFWPPPGWHHHTPNWAVLEQDSELVDAYVRAPHQPLRFYLESGLYEPAMLISNRRLRDVLRAKGYALTYVEHPGAHNALVWRNSLGDGLIALFGPGA